MTFPRQTDATQFAADDAYERLRDAILNGDIRPNRRLVEEELAAWLEISRTPVREALLRLAQEGLVTRSRGWLVRDHAPDEILRIVEARAAVEGAAARLAAARIAGDDIDRLVHIADAIDQPETTRPRLNELNKAFHGIITAASGNFLLVQFAQRTNISYWAFSMTTLLSAQDSAAANAQHRRIIAALAEGDGAMAELLVREHVARTHRVLTDAFDKS